MSTKIGRPRTTRHRKNKKKDHSGPLRVCKAKNKNAKAPTILASFCGQYFGDYGSASCTIFWDGKEVYKTSRYLAECNSEPVAQYEALGYVLDWIAKNAPNESGMIMGSSEMVIQQMSGRWRALSGMYMHLFKSARDTLYGLSGNWKFQWITAQLNNTYAGIRDVAIEQMMQSRQLPLIQEQVIEPIKEPIKEPVKKAPKNQYPLLVYVPPVASAAKAATPLSPPAAPQLQLFDVFGNAYQSSHNQIAA
jgi:ribonuclease HI